MDFFKNHHLWPFVQDIIHKLTKQGYTAWLAGGCVRDFILENKPKDFDVATNATPDEVLRIFPHGLDVGKQFGVIVVPFEKGQVEIATFRSDGTYKDGRHPETVVYTTPNEDALRRDFTVNAMFYDIEQNQIIDFVGGKKDLQDKIIRAVGEPLKRFTEDKLRILRAIRFAAQLDFSIDTETLAALKKMASEIRFVSVERILHELNRTLESPHRARGLELLKEVHLLKELFNFDLETHWGKTLSLLRYEGEIALQWAHLLFYPYFFSKNGPDELNIFFRKYKFSNQLEAEILSILKYFNFLENIKSERKGRALGRLYTPYTEKGFKLYEHIKKIEKQSEENLSYAKKLKNEFTELPKPLLTGNHLIHLGFKPGPQYKDLLQEAYFRQLENKSLTIEDLIHWIKTQ